MLITAGLAAQTIKPITISQKDSYTDHITLKNDATDKDLMVKFDFNEADNTLTVTLISYRMLFVFWDDTRYKSAISRRKIRPDKLGYVANCNPKDCFRLTKTFRNGLPKPYNKHIFKKWFTCDGLQPVDQELQMVNDFIVQVFNIQGKRDKVSVSLRDLMLMDLVKQKEEARSYEISYGKDLNTVYNITIQRDPCFGLEKETETAKKALDAVTKSYTTLKKKYGKGTVSSADGQKAFEELKSTLTAQYQHNNDSSACPAIQDYIDKYNLLADSLSDMKVKVEAPAASVEKVLGAKGSEANGKIVLANARQIDSKVARWLYSHDPLERADIVRECRSIINDTHLLINGLPQDKWGETIKIFRQVEQYFNKTCR
jgi:hypothetical protein